MTLPEYLYKFQAYRLKQIDKQYDMHLQAWLHVQANSTKTQGEKQVPVFKKFNEFFDYEKRINEIMKPKALSTDQKRLAQIAARINS